MICIVVGFCVCLNVLIETLLELEYSVIKSLSMKEATKWLWYDPLVNYRDSFHSIIVVLCCQTIQSRRNIIDTNYSVGVTEIEWVLNANMWLVFLGLFINVRFISWFLLVILREFEYRNQALGIGIRRASPRSRKSNIVVALE